MHEPLVSELIDPVLLANTVAGSSISVGAQPVERDRAPCKMNVHYTKTGPTRATTFGSTF